jgi:hypothetical protein
MNENTETEHLGWTQDFDATAKKRTRLGLMHIKKLKLSL